ncbi:MAG TPA: arylsulfatase [Candidatus Hydrogenedentes bacterium]|mgnify:CR=1 FL=1|nr:arylsulfatase [Candidatus Hydrogenedentota bacterium]HPG65838.1 arylsulfatase [Candidatus Hydrogenedentota bacterium]
MQSLSRRAFLRRAAAASGTAVLARSAGARAAAKASNMPNIVYILADDLGYGDVSCLNRDSKIRTPNIDRIGREGMVFTDAHSPSAVCTPTRYGILTGRYPWRSTLKQGVLDGYSRHLISPERMTVASLLKQHGYHTACVGKWHLGWDWALREGQGKAEDGSVDYAKPVQHGPRDLGFGYNFCIPASLDMPPYVYIEDDACVALPTAHAEGGGDYAFWRPGEALPGFDCHDVLPTLTAKAVEYIQDRADAGGPFFLYFPLTAPHTPIVPNEPFKDASGLNPYADFVMEVDAVVGRVLDALDSHGLAENTLVVFTSDNGCSPKANFPLLEKLGHDPSYVFRGYKADIFEGGHRIPYLVRWPNVVPAGAMCAETVCLTDLLGTAAAIVGATLPDNAGEDSYSLLPVLRGEVLAAPLREATVQASINGSLSIRQGRWKLELCSGSGGWSPPKPQEARTMGLPPIQLYDLEKDVAETLNVCDQHPEIVERLTRLLGQYVENGRSTPGTPQRNEGPTSIWGPSA